MGPHGLGCAVRFFQIGYVTHNVEQAISAMFGADAISSFLILDVARGRDDPEIIFNRIALSFRGDLNIEFIEPTQRPEGIFTPALSTSPQSPSTFHHFGYLLDDEADWDRIEQEARSGGALALGVHTPGMMRYMYVDRRPDLGHYAEYIWLEEGGHAMFEKVPRVSGAAV